MVEAIASGVERGYIDPFVYLRGFRNASFFSFFNILLYIFVLFDKNSRRWISSTI